MQKHLCPILVALGPVLFAAQAAPADSQAAPRPIDQRGDSKALIEDWREQHGAEWRLDADRSTTLLYGGSAESELAPLDEHEWFQVARQFAAHTHAMHGARVENLVPEYLRFLPLSQAGSSDKWTVRLRQELDGVRVVGGYVNVLMDPWGRLLSLQSTAAPDLPASLPPVVLDGASAAGLASAAFRDTQLVSDASSGEAELVFLRVERGESLTATLAWQVDVLAEREGVLPLSRRYWIDAADGTVLKSVSRVHHFDVTGTIKSYVTPGVKPDTGSNPEVQAAMPHMEVSSSAGTVTTDADGNFTFPGVSTALEVTVQYLGTFNDVNHATGTDYSLTVSIPADTPTTVVMNPSPTEEITAQANAYLVKNQLRDWIRSIVPSDSTADFQAVSNCNLNSTCNAYYNGVSTNYYKSGDGCVNTAYSTVVAHEMGHWLNDLYGTGNGSDGMGEGNADMFAMYLFDTNLVGEDFCGSGCHIRDGNNTRPFCGDDNGGCYGQVHTDGEVWMGAGWKIRQNLNATHGDAAGDLVADTLFLSWMNAYNQTQIKSVIEIQWLTLDDDNGDINDGTPNYADIDAGFVAQGFPGYDIPFVTFSGVTDLPDTEDQLGPYVVQATIVAGVAPPVSNATLHYRADEGAWIDLAMTDLGGDLFEGQIPGQVSPAVVDYYLTATDSASNSEDYPYDAPASLFSFNVGILTTFLDFDFEAGGDEGWTVGFPSDTASTGVWERVDPRGTAAQPEDDHTLDPGTTCWVTGQQPVGGSLGTNDVDNGDTTLLSPVFDASGMLNPKISYWRWYSNNQGADPDNDIFEVYLSDDGGSSWDAVEVVGPSGAESNGGWFQHSFEIGSITTPTATMQLRFVASDRNSGSIVEAALDDLLGTDLGPSGSDCNGNGVDDATDIANGTSEDCNGNGIPDECEADCDGDGVPDDCEADCDGDGVPDDCEPDCDGDGLPDDCEEDCNGNGTPDDCETFTDCNGNGIPDECEPDCDGDGIPDDCELDVDGNGIPDECESVGVTYCDPAVVNSSGASAEIAALGSDVVADLDLRLAASQLPTNEFGYFLVSDSQGFVVGPGGSQGNLCLGGVIGRYALLIQNSGPDGHFFIDVDLTYLPPPLKVPVQPGEIWNFQAWFRDHNPGSTSNFTDAVAVTFN